MSSTLDERIRTYLKSHKVVNPINVTFTQKQWVKGQKVDNISSEQNSRHFRNKLNTKVFGNGYRRFKKQLQMLVIREESASQRHHLHCVIEQPQRYSFEHFTYLIEKVWKSTNFGYNEIHIEKPSSIEREDGWLSYIMKDYSKSERNEFVTDLSTSIDFENSTVLDHRRL